MVGHGGSSAGSYLADPTSPIPSHCASIVVTSTVRVKGNTRVCCFHVFDVCVQYNMSYDNCMKRKIMSQDKQVFVET